MLFFLHVGHLLDIRGRDETRRVQQEQLICLTGANSHVVPCSYFVAHLLAYCSSAKKKKKK